MTAVPIRPRMPDFVEEAFYIGDRPPRHSMYWHVLLFLIPVVLLGVVLVVVGGIR